MELHGAFKHMTPPFPAGNLPVNKIVKETKVKKSCLRCLLVTSCIKSVV